MRPKLQEFYNEIGKWVDEGCRKDTFYDGVGLCANLEGYLWSCDTSEFDAVRIELATQFREANLDGEFPFNGSQDNYNMDINMYKNDKRIEWIESHRSDK